MTKLKFILILFLAYFAQRVAMAKDFTVCSPNGRVEAVVSASDKLTLKVCLDGKTLVCAQDISLVVDNGRKVPQNGKARKTAAKKLSEKIDAPFYRQASFDFAASTITLSLGDGFALEVLACDEGVAYRFTTSRKGETVIVDENASFAFTENDRAWLAYSTNDKAPFAMAFQNTYHQTAIDTAQSLPAFLPATVDCGNAKVTILESDLVSYPGMFVQADGGKLRALFAPYPKTMKRYPWRSMTYVGETEKYIAKSQGQRTYPWRIIAVAENDCDMPVNNMVYALARPSRVGDCSWIKPGKVAWDWWNDWNLKGVDFKAGINYETYIYYIDFAASHGLEYVILDEGWYDSKSGDMMRPIDDIRLPELISYARTKGVGIVLWTVFNVLDENLEQICSHYAGMGVKGLKVDFMDRDDQTAVEMVERIADATARHHLLLDLHGIYKPVGLNRTYPNILNYEAVFGMEEARWTDMSQHDMPLYDVTFPYIRMMSGQVDFTPGAMRNGTRKDWRAIYEKPVSMGTRCHQAACYVVQDSPFTMLADSPTSYEADETYTRFIAALPVVFDETRIVDGEIGKYIVTARRKGNDWYVAGQTNWDARDIALKLEFLTEGKTYKATLMADGVNADHDAEDYKISDLVVDNGRVADIRMAQGGGFLMKISPL